MNSAQRTNPATGGNRRRAQYQSTYQRLQNTESPLQKLRRSMGGFRRNGRDQFVACCTAPDHEDRHPSVSISEQPDGRILMFCHAGCETADVLAGAGLTMGDLFPDNGRNHARPVSRGRRWDYRALLRSLRFESTLVIVAANDIVNGNEITQADKDRLTKAAIRIARVAEVAK